jgi:DNA invertase Pin-like site-specific DNA recombinase
MNDLKVEFSKLANGGYLGDSDGLDAYAYLRASSERQVEEGSSFPRQLESIHKAARRDNLRVPFELIFFDDGFTGFEFEHRPALLKLRHETKTNPVARHLIIEDIDRLSRNADWQQGFLLEEFTRHQIQVHFYINPGSQL